MDTCRLVVFDTTLRDGEQAPGFSMTTDEKVRMARQLEALGVDIVEAGFPIASDDDAEAVRKVALALERPIVAALARCAPNDIDRAAWAIAPARRSRIHTFIATSDLHLDRKLRMTREAAHDAAVAMHRVRVVDPKERRFERIATPSAADKRISNGCINVPIAFFDQIVKPTLGRSHAVIYVLPDVKPLRQVFANAYDVNAAQRRADATL